jgi:hypothetical protein
MQRPQSPSDMQSMPNELEQFRHFVDHHESLLPVSERRSSAPFNSPSNPSYTATQRTHTTWSSLPWKIEILSWIGSLCFFIAIIVVLQVLNGRPLPDLRFGITSNAIIGLLVTFAQLIMPVSSAIGLTKWLQALRKHPMDDLRIVDEASRGPWGSFLLIVHRKEGTFIHLEGLFTSVGWRTIHQWKSQPHSVALADLRLDCLHASVPSLPSWRLVSAPFSSKSSHTTPSTPTLTVRHCQQHNS